MVKKTAHGIFVLKEVRLELATRSVDCATFPRNGAFDPWPGNAFSPNRPPTQAPNTGSSDELPCMRMSWMDVYPTVHTWLGLSGSACIGTKALLWVCWSVEGQRKPMQKFPNQQNLYPRLHAFSSKTFACVWNCHCVVRVYVCVRVGGWARVVRGILVCGCLHACVLEIVGLIHMHVNTRSYIHMQARKTYAHKCTCALTLETAA